ncbi:MAG TPA: type II secretion system protein [Candidatus Saccharimonadales bacterium]
MSGFSHREQRGDTIVEVLVCTAIVSLVLVGSYAIANRSMNNIQDTQEHTQALQLVQSQIEQLRSDANAQNLSDFTSAGCYDATGTPQTDTASHCYFNADGTADSNGAEPDFHVVISPGATSGIYKVSASWDSLLGGQANVSLFYGPEISG